MSLEIQLSLTRGKFQLHFDSVIDTSGITAIYGSSGCGKTSFLRSLAGLEKNAEGRIVFNGQVWLDQNSNKPVEQRAVGYVFQEACLFPHLNVAENLNYALKRITKSVVFHFDDVVELLGISHLLDRDSQVLSGGERQRVAIARAILSHPDILLMDEPLAALDRASKREILPYLENLQQYLQLPMIYVSHSEEEIARLADDLIIMQNGGISGQGKLLDMLVCLDSPLAQLDDCFSLIDCCVSQINDDYHLAELTFDELSIFLPMSNLQVGQKVRLRALAKDISLCLQRPKGSSILNILPAKVLQIKSDIHAQCLVSLQVGQRILLARISEFSLRQLKIESGMQVFAQIKAMALIN